MTRHGFLLAGLAALAPASVAAAGGNAAHESVPPRFNPPARATITRTLYRYLSDGNAIVVTRRYDVTFVRVPGGFRIDGALVDAQVDAPPMLEPLAAIERSRPDRAFPMTLDKDGRIIAEARDPAVPVAAHLAAAGSIAAASGMDEGRKRDMLAQLSAVSAAGGQGEAPRDLFTAPAGERRETRTLALPGGGEGQIELTVKVEAAPDPRLPGQIEKTIVTRLAGTTRVSKEVWNLASL